MSAEFLVGTILAIVGLLIAPLFDAGWYGKAFETGPVTFVLFAVGVASSSMLFGMYLGTRRERHDMRGRIDEQEARIKDLEKRPTKEQLDAANESIRKLREAPEDPSALTAKQARIVLKAFDLWDSGSAYLGTFVDPILDQERNTLVSIGVMYKRRPPTILTAIEYRLVPKWVAIARTRRDELEQIARMED